MPARGGFRGRGRGAIRGVARGRGRGGMGRGRGRGAFGRGRGGRGGHMAQEEARDNFMDWEISAADKTVTQDDIKYDINADVTPLFVGTASFDEHYKAQAENRSRYAAAISALESNGVDLSQNAKIRGLAAAWAHADNDLASFVLSYKNSWGMVEVLKALTLLDAGRKIRRLEKTMKRLQMSGHKLNAKQLGKFKSNVDNLAALKPAHGSATGAICKHIRDWVREFTTDELEFFALHMPREPWQRLADICHFNPTKDFPNLPWFLPYCFGASAPEDSMVNRCKDLSVSNMNDLIKEFDIPYSHLKKYKASLHPESKARLAGYSPIDQILWWYEDLMSPEVDQTLCVRLENKDCDIKLPNGKLMERLLTFKMIREDISLSNVEWEWNEEAETLTKRERKPDPNKASFFPKLLPIAQERLQNISLPLESPIVVMGDRSGSMDIAIRTSTIIASLLTAITNARLVFFNTLNMEPEHMPSNIEEVLEMAVSIEADAATSPAASLYPFYEKKEVVKTFIIVTDEEENEPFKGYNFLDLYKKYYAEVHPAHLVFVSFLPDQHSPGKMVTELKQAGFSPVQFKFYASKPDLTKLDKLFGLLSSRTGSFEDQLTELESRIKSQGLKSLVQENKTK